MVRHGISMVGIGPPGPSREYLNPVSSMLLNVVGIGPPGPSREYLNPVSSMGAVRVVEIRSLTLLAVDLLHSTT